MLVGGVERCARCGTLLRGGRAVCPSCGLDQAAADQPAADLPIESIADAGPAPAKKAICPACMTSVPENSLVEYGGQRLCQSCQERIKGKQERKRAEG